jgi:hypothetical protein
VGDTEGGLEAITWMRTLFFLLVFFIVAEAYGQKCEYSTFEPAKVPWGHTRVTIRISTLREIRGLVTDQNGVPITGAAVVLTKIEKEEGKLIGGTYTDDQGRFCFGYPGDGKYSIEFGAEGFNSIEVLFSLSRRVSNSRKLRIYLPVGT